jgi:hypothetical protein
LPVFLLCYCDDDDDDWNVLSENTSFHEVIWTEPTDCHKHGPGRLSFSYSVMHAVAVGPPYTLRLKVKFYSSEPNSLREELTRYQFFLQLKQDILQGRLDCMYQTAVELSALALQCE